MNPVQGLLEGTWRVRNIIDDKYSAMKQTTLVFITAYQESFHLRNMIFVTKCTTPTYCPGDFLQQDKMK